MSIIKQDDLQIIMNKGDNFRCSHHLKPSNVLDGLENDFDLFIDKWCKKENKNKESFQSWKNLIISRIRNKIYSNLKNSNTKSLFYNAKIKQAIANLKNEFVIVPVDKANNNFAIICQKLYCDILKRELCTYCSGIEKFSNFNPYWSFNNSLQVIDSLTMVSAKRIEYFDFATMYTNL